MRKIAAITAALIIGTAAGVELQAMPTKEVPQVRAVASLPRGYAVAESAPSLRELIRQTKPALTFTYGDALTMFVWSTKDKNGRREFTMATARLHSPAKGAAKWVLVSANEKDLTGSFDTLARRSIPVLSNNEVDQSAGKRNWARVVSMDPDRGTLYEIRYFNGAPGRLEQEYVALVMHDPQHGWRFVNHFDGAVAYASGHGMKVATEARWTGKETSSLEVTVTRLHQKSGIQQYYEEDTFAGALPMTSLKSSRAYVIVREGDTFTELMARLAGWEGATREELQKASKEWGKQVLKLNPGLDPSKISVGQEIKIPDEGGC